MSRGVEFHVGSETGRLLGLEHVTYYEEGWEHLEREMAKLPSLIEEKGVAVGGLAMHHYDSYVTMPKGPRG